MKSLKIENDHLKGTMDAESRYMASALGNELDSLHRVLIHHINLGEVYGLLGTIYFGDRFEFIICIYNCQKLYLEDCFHLHWWTQ